MPTSPALTDVQKRVTTYIYEWCMQGGQYALADALFSDCPGLDDELRANFPHELKVWESLVAIQAMTLDEFGSNEMGRLLVAIKIMRDSDSKVSCEELELAVRTEHVLKVLRDRTADDDSIDWAMATKALQTAFPTAEARRKRGQAEANAHPLEETEAVAFRRRKLQALIAASEKKRFGEVDAFLEEHSVSASFALYQAEVARTIELWRARIPPCRLEKLVSRALPVLLASPVPAPAPAAPPGAPPPIASPAAPQRVAAAAPTSQPRAAARSGGSGERVGETAEHDAQPVASAAHAARKRPLPPASAAATEAPPPPPHAHPASPAKAARTAGAGVGAAGASPASAALRSRAAAVRAPIDDSLCAGEEAEEQLAEHEGISSPESAAPVQARPVSAQAVARTSPAAAPRQPSLQPTGRPGPSGVGVRQPAQPAAPVGPARQQGKRRPFSADEVHAAAPERAALEAGRWRAAWDCWPVACREPSWP